MRCQLQLLVDCNHIHCYKMGQHWRTLMLKKHMILKYLRLLWLEYVITNNTQKSQTREPLSNIHWGEDKSLKKKEMRLDLNSCWHLAIYVTLKPRRNFSNIEAQFVMDQLTFFKKLQNSDQWELISEKTPIASQLFSNTEAH